MSHFPLFVYISAAEGRPGVLIFIEERYRLLLVVYIEEIGLWAGIRMCDI